MRVVWSSQADRQVTAAVEFIASDRPVAARRWLEGMLDQVKSLATFPDSGRVVPELEQDDVREFLVHPVSNRLPTRHRSRRGRDRVAYASRVPGRRNGVRCVEQWDELDSLRSRVIPNTLAAQMRAACGCECGTIGTSKGGTTYERNA